MPPLFSEQSNRPIADIGQVSLRRDAASPKRTFTLSTHGAFTRPARLFPISFAFWLQSRSILLCPEVDATTLLQMKCRWNPEAYPLVVI